MSWTIVTYRQCEDSAEELISSRFQPSLGGHLVVPAYRRAPLRPSAFRTVSCHANFTPRRLPSFPPQNFQGQDQILSTGWDPFPSCEQALIKLGTYTQVYMTLYYMISGLSVMQLEVYDTFNGLELVYRCELILPILQSLI